MHLSFVDKDRSGTFCLPPDPRPQKAELRPIHPASAVVWSTPTCRLLLGHGVGPASFPAFLPSIGAYLLHSPSAAPEHCWHKIWLL